MTNHTFAIPLSQKSTSNPLASETPKLNLINPSSHLLPAKATAKYNLHLPWPSARLNSAAETTEQAITNTCKQQKEDQNFWSFSASYSPADFPRPKRSSHTPPAAIETQAACSKQGPRAGDLSPLPLHLPFVTPHPYITSRTLRSERLGVLFQHPLTSTDRPDSSAKARPGCTQHTMLTPYHTLEDLYPRRSQVLTGKLGTEVTT